MSSALQVLNPNSAFKFVCIVDLFSAETEFRIQIRSIHPDDIALVSFSHVLVVTYSSDLFQGLYLPFSVPRGALW